jgi:uncharacterized membrane protein YkoI
MGGIVAFKSLAQKTKFENMLNEGKISQKLFDSYSKDTDLEKLPERLSEKKDNRPKTLEELKAIAKKKLNK